MADTFKDGMLNMGGSQNNRQPMTDPLEKQPPTKEIPMPPKCNALGCEEERESGKHYCSHHSTPHLEQAEPAQSDAPSAAIEPPFIAFLVKEWLPQNSPRKTRLVDMNATETVIAAEAYAALCTAQLTQDLQQARLNAASHQHSAQSLDGQLNQAEFDLKAVIERKDDLRERLTTAEAKVAQLERERVSAERFRDEMEVALGCDTSEGKIWFATGLLERARTLVQRESALSEARERTQDLMWAGSQMANMMFNISQMKERVPADSDRMKMNELRIKWDKARAEILTSSASAKGE